ncbi:TetR/AcrR family transcriptional regulator [Agaribacterium haliotis]|uniref:TetR/AcrR family transcriptional regulator n=1 Tax=Agaribacterium haliotis TaxID=2013869 RepID=UPI000BB58B91|nr:TetR/AcrR family transcriptional regulator [Agaribacterium haliotis]
MVERNAEQTRERILQAAFEEIYQNGYQGMRIDAVLKKTGLAKGALYHHFPNKQSLGYAVVDELLFARTKEIGKRLQSFADPIEGLCCILQDFSSCLSDEELVLGCPVNNLSQEMSGLDEGFQERLSNIYSEKCRAIVCALEKGKTEALVREDVVCENAACFIIASYQGLIGATKCTGNRGMLTALISELCSYIGSLRP